MKELDLPGFISAGQLKDSASEYVIVDCEPKHVYQRSHIPGAHHSPCRYWKGEGSDKGLLGINDPDLFADLVSSWGIQLDSKLVAYDQSGGLYAARLCWTLERFGFTNSCVLDGGLQAWIEEGSPITRELPQTSESHFQWSPVRDFNVAHHTDLKSAIEKEDVVFWDNRSDQEWGRGRIPGARHLEWSRLNDEAGRLLKKPELLSQLKVLNLQSDAPVYVYCLAGVRAAHGYWVLKSLGYRDVKVYDGSWVQYEPSGLLIEKNVR